VTHLLHTYGLLRNSYRPPEEIRGLRDLWRLRERLVGDAGRAVQQMQKALTGMNLQLTNALSDISGVSGMAIIRAIVKGERDPWKLAKLRQPGVRASEAEIAENLRGTWREELLFELRQVVEHYDFLGKQVVELDQLLEKRMTAMPSREVTPKASPVVEKEEAPKGKRRGRKPKTKVKPPPKNAPGFDIGAELTRLLGVDLRTIEGVNIMIAQAVYTEVGPDLSAFPTEGNFTSWLGLTPMRSVSGGKVIKHEKKRVKNRLEDALRMGAAALGKKEELPGGEVPLFEGEAGREESSESDGALSGVSDLPTDDQRASLDRSRGSLFRAEESRAGTADIAKQSTEDGAATGSVGNG
jgi:hypothetical protein